MSVKYVTKDLSIICESMATSHIYCPAQISFFYLLWYYFFAWGSVINTQTKHEM